MLMLSMAIICGLLTARSPEQHQAVGDAEKEYVREALSLYKKVRLFYIDNKVKFSVQNRPFLYIYVYLFIPFVYGFSLLFSFLHFLYFSVSSLFYLFLYFYIVSVL
jgi:hypothetical protein